MAVVVPYVDTGARCRRCGWQVLEAEQRGIGRFLPVAQRASLRAEAAHHSVPLTRMMCAAQASELEFRETFRFRLER